MIPFTALFSVKLCRAIVEGIRNQMFAVRRSSLNEIGVNEVYEDLQQEVMAAQNVDQDKYLGGI